MCLKKFVHLKKPFHWMRSMLVLFISVGVLGMALQMIVMERLNQEALQNYQESLIDSRMYETDSFAQIITSDLDTFRSQIYAMYAGTEFMRLKTSLTEGLITSRYLQDCQYIWSELKMRMFDNSLLSDVSLYMMGSGRKVTTGSVVRISDEERQRLQEMTAGPDNVTLIGQTLYLWVPRIYGKQRQADEMDCITVGSVTETTARRYLNQFSANDSEANLMLLKVDPEGVKPLFRLKADPEADTLIARTDIGMDSMDGSAVVTGVGGSQLITWARVRNLPVVFCEIMPAAMLDGQMSQYNAHLALYRVLVLLATLMLMVMLYSIVRTPLRKLRMALRAVEKGDLSQRLPGTMISDFQYVNDQFNAMSERLQNLLEREYELRLLRMKAELKQLQYQINPHFLYNTYFTLRALLEEEETEKAAAFADLLGRYLKYSVSAHREYATLAEEIEHAKNYAEIQQMRFSQRIDLQWENEPVHLPDMKVPKLILQPLIENAFEHGVRRMLTGGIIRVSFRQGDDVVIQVEDNGQSLTDEHLNELAVKLQENHTLVEDDSVALNNIHRRLKILFGEQSGLMVSRSDLGGLKATVTIHGEMIEV